MRTWIGSVLFNGWLFGSVAIYGLGIVIAMPLGYGVRLRMVRAWVDVTLFLLKRLCRLGYRIDGLDNLPAGNTVVLMKHSSAWETIAQFQWLPRQTWVIKRELLWAPVLGWVIKGMRPIAINRRAGRSAVQQVVEQGSARLRDGFWVVIFPEGTRVPVGETRRYGLSGALLARAAGRSIVPIAHDAGHYWPRRGLIKKPGTIRVAVGPPIATAGREPREINADVRRWIDTRLAEFDRARAADVRCRDSRPTTRCAR